jgi:hypothetical protein
MGMKNPLIMNMEPGEEETMKAMTASSAKMAATCEEKVQEDLQGTVDRVTKKLQGGLEKMGVPINRTKRGTATKADQEAKIKQNKK